MTAYEFMYRDPDASDGERCLTIHADELVVTRFDGSCYAKDQNDKVRASAPASDFIGLEKKSVPDDFVDVRHTSE